MTGRDLCVLALVILLGASAAEAGSVTYSDETTFLAATGATSATGPIPYSSTTYGTAPVIIGDLTIQSASGNLWLKDWSSRYTGNEIALSGVEHLDIDVNLAASTYSFGFRFVEPELDPNVNGAFVDSTFTVSLYAGGSLVDAFTYNAPNDAAAFVGVWSTDGFDEVRIRETVGDIGNEFFGEMFAGKAVLVPIPASGALALLGLGFAGLAALRRRRR